jgi:hypothetical protein
LKTSAKALSPVISTRKLSLNIGLMFVNLLFHLPLLNLNRFVEHPLPGILTLAAILYCFITGKLGSYWKWFLGIWGLQLLRYFLIATGNI